MPIDATRLKTKSIQGIVEFQNDEASLVVEADADLESDATGRVSESLEGCLSTLDEGLEDVISLT